MSLNAPIKEVLLLEDRAYVTRRVLVDLEAGVNVLEFQGVTPTLSDKSLTLEGVGFQVSDVCMVRELDEDTAYKADLARLESELLQAHDMEHDFQAQSASLICLKQEMVSEIQDDVGWGRVALEDWSSMRNLLSERQLELARQKAHTSEQIENLKEELARLKSQVDGQIRLKGHIRATLDVQEKGQFELLIRYCVACACWRPYHRAELSGQRLSWVGQATVWQNTGEVWSEVEVTFSTQRTAQSTTLPPMSADILSARTKDKHVVLQAREQEIFEAGETSLVTVSEVAGIEDGGETFSLQALAPLTLASTGEPARIDLFRFDADCTEKCLARPEVLTSVVLRSHQYNGHSKPLLAGPVDLVKQGRLTGTSWLDFVAPGGEFHLDWGADSELTLKRNQESKKEKEKLLKGWVKTEKRVQLYLSNLSGQEKSVAITERIPVSESKDLTVELNRTETTDNVTADANGFVNWAVVLQPHERKKVNLSYALNRRKSAQMA
jgi:uncharacterized protein (TIGR02231 family)